MVIAVMVRRADCPSRSCCCAKRNPGDDAADHLWPTSGVADTRHDAEKLVVETPRQMVNTSFAIRATVHFYGRMGQIPAPDEAEALRSMIHTVSHKRRRAITCLKLCRIRRLKSRTA
jgi:hypothetical protein